MSDLYIDINPSMYESFLKIFNEVDKDGYISFGLDDYKRQKISAKTLYEAMIIDGRGIFGVSHQVPELVEKMDLQIVKQNDTAFVVFKLAPFLGLPGHNSRKELKELETLLTWISDQTINNPQDTIKINLSRNKKEVDFNISSTSQDLQERLQKEFSEKIESSPVLSSWSNNQKQGFKLVEKRLSILWYGMDTLTLLGLDDRKKVIEERQENNIKQTNIQQNITNIRKVSNRFPKKNTY
jgi:hypothetical protein